MLKRLPLIKLWEKNTSLNLFYFIQLFLKGRPWKSPTLDDLLEDLLSKSISSYKAKDIHGRSSVGTCKYFLKINQVFGSSCQNTFIEYFLSAILFHTTFLERVPPTGLLEGLL